MPQPNNGINGFGSDSRMTRGMQITNTGRISENEDGSFSVPSQTRGDLFYQVAIKEGKWSCTCPDHVYREIVCKHIYSVEFSIALKSYVHGEPKPKVFAPDSIPCDRCGSIRVMKYGTYGDKQRFFCKDCSHKFSEPSLIKRARYSPEVITITLDLYFKGVSLRKISDHLRQFYRLDVDHSTVLRWLGKYVGVMDDYVRTLTPQLSGQWHVDEMAIHVKGGKPSSNGQKGQWKWLWNVLDNETRFQLASEISQTKNEVDGMKVLKQARAIAQAIPKTVVSDKFGSYPMAIERAFIDTANPPSHKRVLGGAGQVDGNQRAERLHNTIRERNKTQRGWKSDKTPLRKGQAIYYNFVRPHMGLENQTPAQKAGISINGENKWMELLTKALADQRPPTKENTH